MTRWVHLFLFTGLVAASCPPHVVRPPKDDAGTDAGVADSADDVGVDAPSDHVVAACNKLRELQCKNRLGQLIGEPTPEGKTCEDVFRNAADGGVDLKPACVAAILACADREKCQ